MHFMLPMWGGDLRVDLAIASGTHPCVHVKRVHHRSSDRSLQADLLIAVYMMVLFLSLLICSKIKFSWLLETLLAWVVPIRIGGCHCPLNVCYFST